MSNRLINESSPYLLQHAENPVDWYPWCEEAFETARAQDKPVFVSIGYSSCHWCHVMAHESFEDEETAKLINDFYVPVKVDREERPDIDSVYMSVCEAFTGSGGWPMSIFMTPEQKPFFAGTYFPKSSKRGMPGLREVLTVLHEKWDEDREELLKSADEITGQLSESESGAETDAGNEEGTRLLDDAVGLYKRAYDREFGGFGIAPKFPAAHNLLFLLTYHEKTGNPESLDMAEQTLKKMYRGGIFDHIGGGFCRYSTDRRFLVPHFEKMLYDNALLIMAYTRAYTVTGERFYRYVAERTAEYIAREMTAPDGGFYSAQDADTGGVEGGYYLLEPWETVKILGAERAEKFNRRFDITEEGNFKGKSIPNLLKSGENDDGERDILDAVYAYRRIRSRPHTDDKRLTSWNALMITALCGLYRATGDKKYLEQALAAREFIEARLCEGDVLYVAFRDGKRGERGFLDDYACYISALTALYEATGKKQFLDRARQFCSRAEQDFADRDGGGFFLNAAEGASLIIRPKEVRDGAMPSGNSVMAQIFVRLHYITGEKKYEEAAERQLAYMTRRAEAYPTQYAAFLSALSDFLEPPDIVTAVAVPGEDVTAVSAAVPNAVVKILDAPTRQYPLKDGKSTFYVCTRRGCMPPVNRIEDMRGTYLFFGR